MYAAGYALPPGYPAAQVANPVQQGARYALPPGYAPAPAHAAGYAFAPGYPPIAAQPAPMPPRIRWTPRQRVAAIVGSWLGQTLMALAVHLATAATLVLGLIWLLASGGDIPTDFTADSFTATIVQWAATERLWATALILLLVCGSLLVAGWLLAALWQRGTGIAKPHRSQWLAWLATTLASGLLGLALWPVALVAGLVAIAALGDFSTGSLWTTLFALLGGAVVLTGLMGMLFGWLFLSTSRPYVDLAALAAAEEAAARARDEAELTRVELRPLPGDDA